MCFVAMLARVVISLNYSLKNINQTIQGRQARRYFYVVGVQSLSSCPQIRSLILFAKKTDRLDFSFDIISPIHCLARGRRLLAVYLFCFYLASAS